MTLGRWDCSEGTVSIVMVLGRGYFGLGFLFLEGVGDAEE